MRENIVVGVSADLSIFERQMARLADETEQGLAQAAGRVEALSRDMVRSQEEAQAEMRAMSRETWEFGRAGLNEWHQYSVRTYDDLARLETAAARDYLAREREKSQASRQFLDGVWSGYQELQGRLVDWTQGGRRIFETFVGQTAAFFEDGLFALFKGRFDDLEEAWQALVDSMLRSFLGFLGDLAAQNLAQTVMGALSGGSLGGLLSSLGLSSGGGLAAGGLVSSVGSVVEAGSGLVSGAVETLGGLLSGFFDQPPARRSESGLVHLGRIQPAVADDRSPAGAFPERPPAVQKFEIHIHGDTLTDPQTLDRVAVKIGEALSRRQRLVFGL